MDWPLTREGLALVLGDAQALPSPSQFELQLAQAELRLITAHDLAVDQDLVGLGWHLHAVASAWTATELYSPVQRRRAFQVASHIFDLQLATTRLSRIDRLRLTFASQVGYLHSSLDPNAIALYRRLALPALRPFSMQDFASASLELGIGLLGSDASWLHDALGTLAVASREMAERLGRPVSVTPYASAFSVRDGVQGMLDYLLAGRAAGMQEAEDALTAAVRSQAASGDYDSRWVAAHLIQLGHLLRAASLWEAIPAEVPARVKRAFAYSSPPILRLWKPQLEMLAEGERSPFSADVRRVLFSVPTSAGKTLLAQVMVAAHVSAGTGDVCVVAPTRALCREIQASIASRLRHIAEEARFVDEFQAESDADRTGRVAVMTPERLAFLIRQDGNAVLDRYGLFIFDEAHIVGDPGRGWTVESCLAFLNHETLQTHHRIVAMSAALGNRVEIATWLDPHGEGRVAHSDWRATRRLTAIFTTRADWERATDSASPHGIPLRTAPTRGRLAVRTSSGQGTHNLELSEDVGQLVLRRDRTPMERFTGTTQFYKSLSAVVANLGRSGPVLIISPTRTDAMRLAGALARLLPEERKSNLADYAALRLGQGHPLVTNLRHGVAYHHASLPDDVLALIESETVSGGVRFVCSTTTLTEGINLPVRTVVIAAQGTYATGGEYEEFITGPRLLNAIGRAGRAAIETDGWVVLARQDAFSNEDFQRLAVGDEDLEARSALATDAALTALEEAETRIRASFDDLFADFGPVVNSFLAFIWTLAAHQESNGGQPQVGQVHEVIARSLAWAQGSQASRERLQALSDLSFQRYQLEEAPRRRRWGRAGLSLAGAQILEALVLDLDPDDFRGERSDAQLLDSLLTPELLERVRSIPEAPRLDVRPYRSAPRARALPIDEVRLLRDWIAGVQIDAIAANNLQGIADAEYRLEVLGDYMAGFVEGFLPWIVGIIVDWFNAAHAEGDGPVLPRRLSGYIRYGVGNPAALTLSRQGVRSRALAHRVAARFNDSGAEGQIRAWLLGLPFRAWTEFCELPIEFKELLEFGRPPSSGLLSRLLEGEEVVMDVLARPGFEAGSHPVLKQRRYRGIDQPGLYAGRRLVAEFNPADVGDILALLATSIPLGTELRADDVQTTVALVLRA